MGEITLLHDSRNLQYRKPFGAVSCNTPVDISLDVAGEFHSCTCVLRIWRQDQGEILLDMEAREHGRYQVTYPAPEVAGLVWYYFIVNCDGATLYYGNNQRNAGGEGCMQYTQPPSYQLTVYRESVIPRWWSQGLVYQIYVDRFHRGKDWKLRFFDAHHRQDRRGPTHMLQMEWRDVPFLYKDDQGRVTRWPFFGGTLEGVREKLSYLHSLGVTVLYLNPIFEAASNHKYDTGDYLSIDPGYGDGETFSRLAKEARRWGIHLVLDGVFSHVGADSKYFNKYGNYSMPGAYQGKSSPYYSWFRFKNEDDPDAYECWWGVDDLPNVDELNPEYQDLIYRGKDSVIRHWLRAGAKGWRLDVADELPDEFIRELKSALRETDPDALLLGEVWEDASNKESYGVLRRYLLGEELDATMNYPFRDICLDFLLGRIGAHQVHDRVMTLYENYPRDHFYACMNLIGSHDRVRILSVLGEAPDEQNMSQWERQAYRLPEEQRYRGKKRLKLAALWQMGFPGVPSIYYGDEVGMEGYQDPYNRGPFPWGEEDEELLSWYKTTGNLRLEYTVLREGEFQSYDEYGDVYGFSRSAAGERVFIFINPLTDQSREISLPLEQDESVLLELLSGTVLTPCISGSENSLRMDIGPLEGKAIYIKKANATAFPMWQLPKAAGILCHITSLPSDYGCGSFGQEAFDFCDFLMKSGQKIWQILPITQIGEGNSPYSGCSAFAGNELLISCQQLEKDGLLDANDLSEALRGSEDKSKFANANRSDFTRARGIKYPLFQKAYAAFSSASGSGRKDAAYMEFSRDNAHWLEDYCLYRAIMDCENLPWQDWPKDIRNRMPEALEAYRLKLANQIDYHRFLQYQFDRQWRALHAYAAHCGISILGDVPFYVGEWSCDVWVHRDLFSLDPTGKAAKKGGVPPDAFTAEGQNWNTPVFDWDAHRESGYRWWIQRLARNFQLHDYIRLDHFRGFEAFYEIPGDHETAIHGYWRKGPGKAFFEAVEAELGPLPLLAENLGFITPCVEDLKNTFVWPGMKIYQFAAEEMTGKPLTVPQQFQVFYTGTHDNDTLAGWLAKRFKDYTPKDVIEECRSIIKQLYETEAMWVILPLQDAWFLDSQSRMNTPGIATGNWNWAAEKADFTESRAEFLRELGEASGRYGSAPHDPLEG